MKQEKLETILESHKMWLNGEKDGVRAYLSGADLCGVDLSGANLRGADLYGADLFGADLRKAYLFGADLREAYLFGANLCGANLRGADLRGANLREANLRGADLCGADLCEANLNNVKYNESTSFFALQCPEKGAFIGYKKVNGIIIELEIPQDAKRSSATTRKCRCSKAKVLGFYDCDRNELNIKKVINHNYVETVYRKGEMVYPDKWDEDRRNECSNGIHFFITFDEAKNY